MLNIQNETSVTGDARREKRRKYLQAWRDKNPLKHLKHRRDYYARNKKHIQERQRARRRANPELTRHHNLRSDYGISLVQYEEMLLQQSGVCAVCGRPPKDNYNRRLGVDHDHKTGKVRGLLCVECNLALGYVDDSTTRMDQLKWYLEKNR